MDHIRLRRNWRPRCRLLVLPTLMFACLSLLLLAGLSLYGEEDSTESQHHHSALGDVDTSEALVDEQLDTIDPSGKDLTSVDAVIDAYRRFHDARGRHSRLASPSYRRWAEFALGRQCAVHEQEYAQIEKDIGRFRIAFAQRWLSSEVAKRTATRRKLDLKRLDTWSEADVEALVAEVEPHASVISASAVDEAARIPRVARLRVADGQVHITVNSPELDQSIVSALREVAQLPGSPVDLVFNMLDEPRVLKRPPDTRRYNATEDMALRYNGDEGMYEKKEGCGSIIPLMESVCDGVSRNGGGISRQQLESHGFFQAPTSLYLTDRLLPVLSSATVRACFADIVFPSNYYLRAEDGPPVNFDDPNIADSMRDAWKEKRDQVFWRGSSTSGCAAPGNNYPRFHRQRFIEQFGKRGLVFAKNATHMNSYDIGFTAIIQCEGSACEEENLRYGPILANVPHEMAFQYKYLADIDGNTFSQRFLPFLRRSNSLVIKLSLFEDWVTGQTSAGPDGHYLTAPLTNFTTSLPSQLEWARTHPKESRDIIKRARLHAQKRLRRADMICYLGRLLVEMEAAMREESGREAVREYLMAKTRRNRGKSVQESGGNVWNWMLGAV